jgi:hypothetical protein
VKNCRGEFEWGNRERNGRISHVLGIHGNGEEGVIRETVDAVGEGSLQTFERPAKIFQDRFCP